jgi:hypothetical protein
MGAKDVMQTSESSRSMAYRQNYWPAMSGNGEQFSPVCSAQTHSDAGTAEGAEAKAAQGIAAEGRQGRWHIDTDGRHDS